MALSRVRTSGGCKAMYASRRAATIAAPSARDERLRLVEPDGMDGILARLPYGSVSTQLDLAFGALADPTRRGILERLGRRDALISDLADAFELTLTGVKKDVQVLENEGRVHIGLLHDRGTRRHVELRHGGRAQSELRGTRQGARRACVTLSR